MNNIMQNLFEKICFNKEFTVKEKLLILDKSLLKL
jgi:hypothetical protein